jgi:uncharacterized repeat protein (TIGR04076 family)
MAKIKLTITESKCRSGFHKKGQEFIVDETICPPICMELWHYAYPYVWALLNGGELDNEDTKSKTFDIICPDEGRVHLHGEVIEEG